MPKNRNRGAQGGRARHNNQSAQAVGKLGGPSPRHAETAAKDGNFAEFDENGVPETGELGHRLGEVGPALQGDERAWQGTTWEATGAESQEKGASRDKPGRVRDRSGNGASGNGRAFGKTGGRRPLAVITGASSGIGYELARVCATQGFDLIVAASSSGIKTAGARLASLGVDVRAVQTDLSNEDGVDVLYDAVRETGRGVDILCANAGRGVGDTFLNEDWDAIRMVIDTNVTGTVYLLHRFARDMKKRGSGRILVTGSIAGFIPGPYQAVYNASKAFVDNFAYALRNEMKDTGVSVTCLMPGATETPFFDKAGLEDTPMGRAEKDNPLDVAITGFAAMMRGDPAVVYGIKNKAAVAASRVLPKTWVAEVHRWVAQPEGNQ